MLFLLMCSAFCSLSEAALFSLNQSQRRELQEKGQLGKVLTKLLEQPEKLLNSILLANLFVNLLFFTLASIIAFRLGEQSTLAWLFGFGALLTIIVFAEVLPKNVSVMFPQTFALLVCVPLSFLVRLLQPILPVLSFLNLISRRVVYPDFKPEPYLRVSDLERAVALSGPVGPKGDKAGNDASLLKREQRSLQNIVALSDMQAVELMRPRSWLKLFRPPITFEQILTELAGTLPRSGYCLFTEPDSDRRGGARAQSDEIVSALSLTRLTAANLETAWEEQLEDVVYVPWSTSVAEVFDRLLQADLKVAVVINEFGETIGIITVDDIVSTIFTREQGRSQGILNRRELLPMGQNHWQLTGLTSLRTLERKFGVSFRQYSSLTVGGLLRELLERLPRIGDQSLVDNLRFSVVSVDEDFGLVVELHTN